MSLNERVIIVGGGFTGLSAAYDLTKAGIPVTVLESDADLGGLGGVFEIQPGVKIEKFYHHWFTSDTAIIDLVKELGLGQYLSPKSSNTGLFYANSIFRLSSPLDLLKFPGIPFLDRVRTGLMVVAAKSISNWKKLENISAEDWILRWGGRKTFDVIWQPLLRGKFGPEASHISAVWFWNKLKLRGGSRNKKGGEELVYLEGSFGRLIKALADAVIAQGGEIRTKTQVTGIEIKDDKVVGVTAGGEMLPAKRVLVTTPLPIFLDLCPKLPESFRNQCTSIRHLGNVCLILRLKRSLSSTYWLNVADPSFPFVGIIEHSNFEELKNLGGEHIAYLSKYLPTTEFLYRASDDEVFEFCLPYLVRMFPEFSRSWVIAHHVWRSPYSQPVITKHYSSHIPAHKTPVEGLWLSNMAQIYPEDRGTNYAVRDGRRVAAEMMKV